jgi:hypothetical protein
MPVTLMNDDTYINEKCEPIIFVVTDLPFFMDCSREFHMNLFCMPSFVCTIEMETDILKLK